MASSSCLIAFRQSVRTATALSVSVCCFSSVLFTTALFATAAPRAEASPAESIGPLEARSIGEIEQTIDLDETADAMNSSAEEDEAAESASVGFDPRKLPVIGKMLDDDGNLNLRRYMPIAVDFSDIEGGTSVMLEGRFSVD